MESLVITITKEIKSSSFTHKVTSNINDSSSVVTCQIKTPIDCDDMLRRMLSESDDSSTSSIKVDIGIVRDGKSYTTHRSMNRIKLLDSLRTLISLPVIPDEYGVSLTISNSRNQRYNVQIVLTPRE